MVPNHEVIIPSLSRPSVGTFSFLTFCRKQVCTEFSIKSTNQINEDGAFKVLPTIEKLFNIHQIPCLPFFHNHLHQIVLKTPACIFYILNQIFPPFVLPGSSYVSRREWRRKEQTFLPIGRRTPEIFQSIYASIFLG